MSTCSVGPLRLRLPQPIRAYHGTLNATAYGNQCFQQGSNPDSQPSFPPEVAESLGTLLEQKVLDGVAVERGAFQWKRAYGVMEK